MIQHDLMTMAVTNGFRPVATNCNSNAVEKVCEQLKLERLGYKQRCEQLEKLCRILFKRCDPWDCQTTDDVISYDEAHDRMTDLGLLDDERDTEAEHARHITVSDSLAETENVGDRFEFAGATDTARERPSHYTSSEIETIDKVNAVVRGLPAESAWLLGNVIKYVDRAGKKLDATDDLSKAHDYAHRLVLGDWDQERRNG